MSAFTVQRSGFSVLVPVSVETHGVNSSDKMMAADQNQNQNLEP